MIKFSINNKAFALVLAAFVLLAFSVTGLTALSLMSRRIDSYVNQIYSLKGLYLAESAKNYFMESVLPFEHTLTGNTYPTKTLGATNATFTISASLGGDAKGLPATMTFTGSQPLPQSNFQHQIIIGFAEDLTQNQNIVANLKKYYGFLGDPDTKAITCLCNPTGGCVHGWSTSGFFANTYIPGGYSLSVDPVVGCPCASWGSSTQLVDLYVSGAVSLSFNYPVCNYYGVSRNVYASGGITVTHPNDCIGGTCIHGAKYQNCQCATNSECCWPTKPPIDNAYYDKLLAKASALSVSSDLTIDTVNNATYRNLNNRNLYVKGNVTITANSNYPMSGPGNIVATGTITINDGTQIRDRIGLIAGLGVVINQSSLGTYVGGTFNSTDGFIHGEGGTGSSEGVVIYAKSGGVNVAGRLKAFILTPTTGAVDNRITLTEYTKLQGLIYAEEISSSSGAIYGNVYTDNIQDNTINTTYLYNQMIPGWTAESERPIKLRGLYDLAITSIAYQ